MMILLIKKNNVTVCISGVSPQYRNFFRIAAFQMIRVRDTNWKNWKQKIKKMVQWGEIAWKRNMGHVCFVQQRLREIKLHKTSKINQIHLFNGDGAFWLGRKTRQTQNLLTIRDVHLVSGVEVWGVRRSIRPSDWCSCRERWSEYRRASLKCIGIRKWAGPTVRHATDARTSPVALCSWSFTYGTKEVLASNAFRKFVVWKKTTTEVYLQLLKKKDRWGEEKKK